MSPIKIILFGSQATGTATSHSDIDLLIVLSDGSSKRKTARYLYQTIENITIPYDLVVVTEYSLNQYKDVPGLIYQNILREGREI